MDDIGPKDLVFAEVSYPEHYSLVHGEMVALLTGHFSNLESGLQGDSWILVHDGNIKVAVDSFTSRKLKHQVKSVAFSPLVQKVIETLRTRFDVEVVDPPRDPWD